MNEESEAPDGLPRSSDRAMAHPILAEKNATPPATTPSPLNDKADGDQSNPKANSATKDDEYLSDGDDPESYSQAKDAVQNLAFDTLWAKKFKQEKLQGKLKLRSKQAIIHLSYTEIRLAELEAKLGELQEKLEKGRNDYKGKEKERCPVFMPALKWMAVDEFRVLGRTDPLPPNQLPAIEILYSIGSTMDHSKSREEHNFVSGAPEHQEAMLKIPERLRIRSWPLLWHLEKICGEDFSLSSIKAEDIRPAVVLLRPFKALVLFEQAIRDSVSDVETELEAAKAKGEGGIASEGSFDNHIFDWKDLLANLKLLIEFMDTALHPTYELRQSITKGTLEDIEYAGLWHLFQIGDIITRRDAKNQVFKVLNIVGGRETLTVRMNTEAERSPSLQGFTLDCISLVYDGSSYVPQLHKFHISKFTGYQKISSLEVYPIRFESDAGALKDRLISNGRRYIELTRRRHSHVMFRGRTVDDTPQEIEGQIVIDTAMALSAEPDWRPSPVVNEEDLTKPDLRETYLVQRCIHKTSFEGCCGGDIAFKDQKMNIEKRNPILKEFAFFLRPRAEKELGDDMILLPNSVYGFVLRLRKWVTVQIQDLSEVAFDNDFNNLMMNETRKQAILAVVETHEKSRLSPDAEKHSIGTSLDLVTGKGTGLILLLHGEPGVGKTSTAECVADRTERPLFPITCGDIGETAMEVERNLQHNFRLAHRWGCVLLLDEADVFLAKRNRTDLRRNAVTSVFLRSLDYYAGILFLTTNRVGGIDPAFKSRIHLSVFYPRLDLERTQKLFNVFLQKTKDKQRQAGVPTFDIKSKEICRFAKKNYRSLKKQGFNTWNGRQIRNAFQTAIALVEYEVSQMEPGDPKPTLGKKQFEVVADGSKQFDVYLMRTLQGRDADIAIRDQWRDDTFELEDLGNGTQVKNELLTMKKSDAKHRSVKDESSVTASDSESESEESDDEEKDEEGQGGLKDAKSGGSKSSGGVEMEEYQQFLQFQAMKRAMGK